MIYCLILSGFSTAFYSLVLFPIVFVQIRPLVFNSLYYFFISYRNAVSFLFFHCYFPLSPFNYIFTVIDSFMNVFCFISLRLVCVFTTFPSLPPFLFSSFPPRFLPSLPCPSQHVLETNLILLIRLPSLPA